MNVNTMLNNRKLIVDTMSEVYDLLLPYRTDEFWDLREHTVQSHSVYVLGRRQLVENTEQVKQMAQDPTITVVFGNSAEGSLTLKEQCRVLGMTELIAQGQILLLSGGDMEPEIPHLLHEHFLTRIQDYEENVAAQAHTAEIYQQRDKPHTFLFLNGRARPHRKYLLERFRQMGILDQSLWTMLDGRGTSNRLLSVRDDQGQELMRTTTPIQHLPSRYEFHQFRHAKVTNDYPHKFIKYELFNNLWGEIYLTPEPYVDTYFSVITETVFEYPYSFRTEKIAKPLMMGHPFVVAANQGFYRDLRNLGFRTFHGIIDEGFDTIECHQTRMERVAHTVQELCQGPLDQFLDQCYTVCKHNQQHLQELAPQLRAQFPQQFFDFIGQHDRSRV